jgi:hypothetical protein
MLVVICAAAANAADLRLRSGAVCATSVVRVADVAEVFASDYRLAQSLAEVPLCPAPAAGRERVLTQEHIRQLVELSGAEKKSFTITGSETVTITTGGTSIAATSARQPLVASGVRQAAFEVLAPPTTPAKPAVLPVAKPANAPLADAKPTPTAPLIAKGAGLTVHARTSGVQITTSGKAIQAGGLNDTIAVELIDSKQKVNARVLDAQTVEISNVPPTAPTIVKSAN